jgi:hypothetical protein
MRFQGFGGSAPAQPQVADTSGDIKAARKAREEIASRNQGSNRRAEFTRKQRAALLIKSKEDESALG